MEVQFFKRNKVALGVLLFITLVALHNITSYAADVGDIVTAEYQEEIKGVKYPADGSSIESIVIDSTSGLECYVFTDKTAVLMGNVLKNSSPKVPSNLLSDVKVLIIKQSVKRLPAKLMTKTEKSVQFYVEGNVLDSVKIGESSNYTVLQGNYMGDSLTISNSELGMECILEVKFTELILTGSNSVDYRAFKQCEISDLIITGGSYSASSTSGKAGAFMECTIGNVNLSGNLSMSSYSNNGGYSPLQTSTIENIHSSYNATSNASMWLTGVTVTESIYDNSTFNINNRYKNTKCKNLYLTDPSFNLSGFDLFQYSVITNIYIFGDIDDDVVVTRPSTPLGINWHVMDNTRAKAALISAGRSWSLITEEEIESITKGKSPSLQQEDKLFDFDSSLDIKFNVDLGKKPAGATGITSVLVDNAKLSKNSYEFNGTNTITIKNSFLKTLCNGNHYVSVLFNNGTFKSGATIYVMGSNVPVVDPNKPPEALDTVKYEFYKDYPDYVIIPVSLNGATQVTKLKVGTEIVDEAYYELDEGAIIIAYDYLRTLDAGKYRVLPTFNDPAITTLNNIQLYVYENAADRAAPYLLQTRILFKGQNFKLKFDSGLGSLEAMNVLALVIDDQMLLQNGTILPFSKTNITKVKKTLIADTPKASPSETIRYTEVVEKDEIATPSEASKASPSEVTMSIMGYLVDIFQSPVPMSNDLSSEAFYVVNNEVYVNGSIIAAMELEEGDHLIGAIFDNTEKTTDIKKVILSIPPGGGNDNDNGNNDNGNNGNGNNGNGSNGNNENGNNGNAGDPGDSGGSDKDNNSGSGNGGNSGNGGSGSGGGKNPGGNDSSGGSGTTGENSKDKPKVPDDGGTWFVNPNDPTDVTYKDKDGNPAPNKWIGDGEYWRHTNSESKIDHGWFKDTDGTWYLLNKEPGENFGSAKSSWHYENQDGMWYYLSTKNAAMLKGWNQIDGKWYYFTEVNAGQTYYGNNVTGWFFDPTKFIKPLGSMWADERTPDGYLVDKNGVWIN